jgi:glycosyltransferase involved in cell wall biosynthesis
VAIPEGFAAGPVNTYLRATLESGELCVHKIANVALMATVDLSPAKFPQTPIDRPLVAICMATCNPPLTLFKRQIKSLLEQSYTNWVCIVSDDSSRSDTYSEIGAAIGGDPRFCAFQSADRLGFYRNFERCLSYVPIGASFIAFCDQDDIWHSDKLESLLSAFDPLTSLAYSDMRIVDIHGKVISETYWTTRVNNCRSLASLLIANTVTGAASMFRRKLLELALPFPELPGEPYHDHWIACVALAAGKIAYVDRPLHDYVQHGRNVIGHFTAESPSWWRNAWLVVRSKAALGHTLALYRKIYFNDVLRVELIADILQQRCHMLLDTRKRRILQRFSWIDGFLTCLWMAVRRVREIWRGNETLAAETRLLRGVLWRHCSVLRSRFGPDPPIERLHRR